MGLWDERAFDIEAMKQDGKTDWQIAQHYGVSLKTYVNRSAELRHKNLLTPVDTRNHRAALQDLSALAPHINSRDVNVEYIDKKKVSFDARVYLQRKIEEQEILQSKNVSQKELTINIHTDRPFAIAFSADWHLGSPGVDYATFLRHTETIISTPNLYTATIGDMVDNFIKTKIKSAMLHSLFNPKEQYDVVREIFKMLGRKLLFYIGGNHDAWTDAESGIDMLAVIAEMLQGDDGKGIPYLRDGGGININVNDGEVLYRIFAKHQYRFKSAFNSTHTVKRMNELESHFDVGVTAHTHNPAVEQTHRWNGVYGHDAIYVVCGTYKIEDSHAAAFGYGQSSWISTPVIIFYPHEKRMVPFYNFEDGVEMVRLLNAEYEAAAANE